MCLGRIVIIIVSIRFVVILPLIAFAVRNHDLHIFLVLVIELKLTPEHTNQS